MRLTIAILLGAIGCLVNQRCDAVPTDGKPHGKDFSSSLHSHPNAQPVVLPKGYLQAVKNAENATEENISRRLTPILQSNKELIWRANGNDRQVLVATWTTHRSYFPNPGTTYQEKFTVWVTAAPELKKFCIEHGPGEGNSSLPRRLEQLLGLPPNSGHKYVVELWVDPDDLFRPSADPEVTDYEAQLEFPDVRGYMSVSDQYQQWYKTTAAARYRPTSGPAYPWTRLGYTYDWGNAETRVGLSEFVIREGAELTVHSVNTTENYGASAPP